MTTKTTKTSLASLNKTIARLYAEHLRIEEELSDALRAQRRIMFETTRAASLGQLKGWKSLKASSVKKGDRIRLENGKIKTVEMITKQDYGNLISFQWVEKADGRWCADRCSKSRLFVVARP